MTDTPIDPTPDAGGFVTVSSRLAYENPWTRLREDIIIRPNGRKGLYGVVERGDFVVILPLWEEGGKRFVTLIQQYRYPIKQRMWELPMGMWETRPDASAEDVARGELREETGLLAETMRDAGLMYQGAGYTTQKGRAYLATGLTQGPPAREDTEEDITCHKVTLEEMEAMIRDGRITCMVTIAAFGLIRAQGWI
ncbi:NUDIX hydrolase [Gluconacetobacter entanii]|uniref:GDP-mannose pyrophosphatase n=1 Tax=Gluconacetobacter entanii TaxID=108528 RepID=A0ABT3K5B5_9PROT|nr:NUDIX hydrolase [Gluconacetobacter entanii]MBE7620623.1 NUDIX domain-containing protein [Komagataeibacter sp. FXV2]MBY4641377.1 NUDIX hydrolase [Gluconacetobacter entanii]MCW4580583.1 NUDIX hydrolase [Gluconacetobacter entanii]MCW4583910.1 NUDIX hydrolase [Gluconacetobacter entanii]MCW4587255.1 NUDIX hydrolase [Gluconacetobacter entanii]